MDALPGATAVESLGAREVSIRHDGANWRMGAPMCIMDIEDLTSVLERSCAGLHIYCLRLLCWETPV